VFRAAGAQDTRQSTAMKKGPIDPITLSERVYRHILEQMLQRELLPGQIINRRLVADRLGVSIAPVLEALVRLEAEGLVTTISRKGTQVRLVRAEDVAEQMMVREAIECQAARYYCGETVARNEARLRSLADKVDRHQGSPLDIWRAEMEFHGALVELTTCRALLDAFRQQMHLGSLCFTDFFTTPSPDSHERKHRALLRRLKAAGPDAAERLIRQHLRNGKPFVFQRRQ
jgi:DNA-binding GntR family transcriptional regulator